MKELHEIALSEHISSKQSLLGVQMDISDINNDKLFVVAIVDIESKIMMKVEFVSDMYNGYPMRLNTITYNKELDEDSIKHCMRIIENAITDYVSSKEVVFQPDRTFIQTTKFFYAKLNRSISYKFLEWFAGLKKEEEYIFYQ